MSPLPAQTQATVGMSASVVEYEGFLASGAATLTPTLRFDTPNLSFGGHGSWTIFESGNQILQGTLAAAWLTPPHARWRLELSAAAGASKYAEEPGSAHVLARGRIHRFHGRSGAWIGATAGAAVEGTADAAIELALGAWRTQERFAFVGTVTRTWMGDEDYVDVEGAARWTGGRVELEARLGARPWAVSDGRVGEPVIGAHGEVSALISLGARVALSLSGGSYPSDPVRRVLGARYVAAGIRLALVEPGGAPAPVPATRIAASLPRQPEPGNGAVARLEIEPAGGLYTLRVRVAGATTVEVMGDFTDWQALPLARVSDGTWEIRLPLTQGVHRLNIRVDGGEWVVPVGARAEAGEFGGAVGVVIVR